MRQLENLLKNEVSLTAIPPLREVLKELVQILAEFMGTGVAINVPFLGNSIYAGGDEKALRDIEDAYLNKECVFIGELEKDIGIAVQYYKMETAKGTCDFLVIPAEMNTQRVGEIIVSDQGSCSDHCLLILKLVSLIIFLLIAREKTVSMVKDYFQENCFLLNNG